MPEISANEWIESQTESIKRQFKRSKPRPRASVMGFRVEDRRSEKRNRMEKLLDLADKDRERALTLMSLLS